MEIEAKFEIADLATFNQIYTLSELEQYDLRPPVLKIMTDIYYDTDEQILLKNNYCCRLRDIYVDGNYQNTQVTLKNLTTSANAILERMELETTLSSYSPIPTNWPPSEVREMILSLSGETSLDLLLTLIQKRYKRHVIDKQRLVAELSLDQVEFQSASGKDEYMVLEMEILQDGTITDLNNLVSAIQARWFLKEIHQSKFQRALNLVMAK